MAMLSTIEVAIRLGFSVELVTKLTKNCPKSGGTRLLRSAKEADGIIYFDQDDVDRYQDYLSEPWPRPASGKSARPGLPDYIRDDVRQESHFMCAICGAMDNGEIAHIEPVSSTLNNSPDNLLLLCPNHHTEYDYGFHASSNVNRDVVRAAKVMKRETRRRILRFEVNAYRAVAEIVTFLKKVLDAAKTGESDELRRLNAVELSGLMRVVPELLAKANDASAHDKTLDDAQAAIRKAVPGITKAAEGIRLAKKESDIRSTAAAVVAASHGIVIDLDEEDCPHCGGCGQTGLAGDLCAYCRGSCWVTRQKKARYDPADLDEVACPRCAGSGITGLAGDFCKYCRGSCVVTAAKAESYDAADVDEVECPRCAGAGLIGLSGDYCPYCRGSCFVSRVRHGAYDEAELEETTCPFCEGAGTYGLCGDVCPVCRGRQHIRLDLADSYDRDEVDLVDCPRCEGAGLIGIAGDFCSYCRGSCLVTQAYADEYDADDMDEITCPRCGGLGTVGLVGDRCKLCRGKQVVDRDTSEAYRHSRE